MKDRDTLDLMTGTILTLPLKTSGHPRFRIDVAVDGQRPASVYVSDIGETRPRHPKPKREIRYRISAYGGTAEPTELCLQLSTLGSR